MDKKISVIMGIYNCSKTLPEAIDSIIAQTYTNWQLIMCDDCSTDNTYAVAHSYQIKYPEKIILIRNDVNSRLAFSLNHCLKYADGDYIARMDGDDISDPERFKKQVKFLNENPDYDLVGTTMRRFDESGFADIVTQIEKPDKFSLRHSNPFHHATIMARRKVYDTLNGYTVSSRTVRGQDSDLWFRFYHAGFNGYNMMEPLYYVREDGNAIRRRTIKVRLNALRTTFWGYKLLKFPKRWLILPIVRTVIKCFIPYKFVEFHRTWQKHHN